MKYILFILLSFSSLGFSNVEYQSKSTQEKILFQLERNNELLLELTSILISSAGQTQARIEEVKFILNSWSDFILPEQWDNEGNRITDYNNLHN